MSAEYKNIKQYYCGVEDGQFLNRGYAINLSDEVAIVGDCNFSSRLESLEMTILGKVYRSEFILGKSIDGLEIEPMYSELIEKAAALFQPVLPRETVDPFLQSSSQGKIILYSRSSVNNTATDDNKSLRHLIGLRGVACIKESDKLPRIFIELTHLNELRAHLDRMVMQMRLEGDLITDQDLERLKAMYVHREVKTSITHELLHWLLFIVRPSLESHDKMDCEIESLAMYIVEEQEGRVTQKPSIDQLRKFVGL